MLPLNLSETEIETIKVNKNSHTCPGVRTRLLILWMVHCGFRREDAAMAADCHVNSVANAVKMFNEGGLERIMRVPSSNLEFALSSRLGEVKKQLKEACVSTLKEGQYSSSVRAQFIRIRFASALVTSFLED